jgi:hypothetical protein
MSSLKAQIEHHGVTYDAEVATINSTRLGWEDHGCFQAQLNVTYGSGGSGTSIAGMILDTVPATREPGSERRPTLFGMAMIQGLICTLAGDFGNWESLKGQRIFTLFDPADEPRHGFLCKGVASIDGRRVLVFDEVLRQWEKGDD